MPQLSLSLALLGVGASLASELVSWLNKKLNGTPFHGNASLFVSIGLSLVAGCVKVFFLSGVHVASLKDLTDAFILSFGISQAWFATISTWFSKYLQVQDDTSPAKSTIVISSNSSSATLVSAVNTDLPA